MKKIIFALLTSALLFGCGSSAPSNSDSDETKQPIVSIDEETFLSYFSFEELTLDNYNNYIVFEERPIIDSFGNETLERWVVGIQKSDVAGFKDAVLHYQHNVIEKYYEYNQETKEVGQLLSEIPNFYEREIKFGGELFELELASSFYGDHIGTVESDDNGIDNIKGKVYFLNIPDAMWNTDEQGNKFVRVKNEDRFSDFYSDGKIYYKDNDGNLITENDTTINNVYNYQPTYQYWFFREVKDKLS